MEKEEEDQERIVKKAKKENTHKSAVSGLKVFEDFITIEEEEQLLKAIDKEEWSDALRRRTQHYGYKYNYKKRNIDESDYLGSLPSWCDFILEKLLSQKIAQQKPVQLIVNEYEPGVGISKHIDAKVFGEMIFSLSLNSSCIMTFRKKGETPIDVLLKSRSLLKIEGEARHDWTHEIVGRKFDTLPNGTTLPRKRRVSLTFRFLKE